MNPKFPLAVTFPHIRKSSTASALTVGEANGMKEHATIVKMR